MQEALDSLPPDLRAAVSNVEIVVEDEPPDERAARPLPGHAADRRGSGYSGALPDKITIFRGPLERLYGWDPERLRARRSARRPARARAPLRDQRRAPDRARPLLTVVEDGLDVVAVGVEQERAVVARVVLGRSPGAPLSRPPAARPARWNACDRSHGRRRRRRGARARSAGPRGSRTVSRPATKWSARPVLVVVDPQPDVGRDRPVEGGGGGEVANADPQVIDEPSRRRGSSRADRLDALPSGSRTNAP